MTGPSWLIKSLGKCPMNAVLPHMAAAQVRNMNRTHLCTHDRHECLTLQMVAPCNGMCSMDWQSACTLRSQ